MISGFIWFIFRDYSTGERLGRRGGRQESGDLAEGSREISWMTLLRGSFEIFSPNGLRFRKGNFPVYKLAEEVVKRRDLFFVKTLRVVQNESSPKEDDADADAYRRICDFFRRFKGFGGVSHWNRTNCQEVRLANLGLPVEAFFFPTEFLDARQGDI